MEDYIRQFSVNVIAALEDLPTEEIAKALDILQATYERDGRIYVFGNGGSLALATHWVSDFNKTVFSHHLDKHSRRFQSHTPADNGRGTYRVGRTMSGSTWCSPGRCATTYRIRIP